MNKQVIKKFNMGTFIQSEGFWEVPMAGAALCPDGIVRKLKRICNLNTKGGNQLNAAVNYKGKTVSGTISFVPELEIIRFDASGKNRSDFFADEKIETITEESLQNA